MNVETIIKLVESWKNIDGNVNKTSDIIKWVNELNSGVKVTINKNSLEDSSFWFYDKDIGIIRNKNNSFFSIAGYRKKINNEIINQQPIIIQNEIGYLGVICKEIDGVINFLMQAKIEPGNINKIQISPTIQATKSNFTQKHGGNKPKYLEYFINSDNYETIADQLQSEQSSRFYKKRNRNIIIKVDEEIEISQNYRWMTLGQIKELMKINNLINMDTRTVLSCIPFSICKFTQDELIKIEKNFNEKDLFKSIFLGDKNSDIVSIYQYINNYKMFDESKEEICSLEKLQNWNFVNNEIRCNEKYDFKVIFCDISIEGREVKNWTQPLLEANGIATLGLIMCNDNGVKKFLISCKDEIGCFDKIELGPTVQIEYTQHSIKYDYITKLFFDMYNKKKYTRYDVILSEEGGRFYHEQNHNIIIEIDKSKVNTIPNGYFWVDYKTLNIMTQINNCLNIQLRNLLCLLEIR
ncbi:MAG: NDP-hexose 2,3-dehydratase family protein [Clostridium butyricum]|nr:NDP-hexose 2,3-dehydratase family protein [Clostridium butyricum]